MVCTEWREGPYGLDAAKGSTVRGERTVLMVVHHVTAGTRLAEAASLLEGDRRVQVVYTASPASVLSVGVEDFLRRLGGVTIPYEQAIRIRFDLAVAAGNGGLQQLHAPVLTLPHGVGPGLLIHRWAGSGPTAPRPAAGLRPDSIVAGGRVIPAAITVGHEEHRTSLGRVCPEALPVTVVTGDLAFDRIVASLGRRRTYRRALGVAEGQDLVVVSSTWGPRSLLGRHGDLPSRLATVLPRRRYRIAVLLHPNIWCWHGGRQIRAWLADCLRLGVRLIPPEEGWQAALVAADRLVGDYGSVTCYGAALGVSTLLAAFPDGDVVPGSVNALLGETAPRLDLGRPVAAQLDAATMSADRRDLLRERLTSRPGQAAPVIRRVMYKLMRLPEPSEPPRLESASIPPTVRDDVLGVDR